MPKIFLIANTDWYLYNFRLAFAKFLRLQGMEVVFVCPAGKYIEHVMDEGFRWIQWEIGRKTLNPIGEIAAFLNLLEIYRVEKPHLIHHHTIKPVIYGSLAARIADIGGIINSITGSGYIFSSLDLKARILKPFVELLFRWVLRKPNIKLIFENQNDQLLFISQRLASREQTSLIGGVGVDTKKFSPTPEPATGAIVILMASRMIWDKGVGIFVEAAALLHQRHAIRAVLVGEPDSGNPSTVDTKTLLTWQNNGVIEWWGWQADMPSILQQCHIVAFPTMYGEGVPTILLEATACGRPVVTTDVPGCRDVVTHGVNGLLVPARNAAALADAMEILILDPELRRKMGQAGRDIAVNQFSILKVNTETLAIYQKALASF